MPTLQIMRLRAIMFDKIQRVHRHTFTSHTAMKQSPVCWSSTPSGEPQTETTAQDPTTALTTPHSHRRLTPLICLRMNGSKVIGAGLSYRQVNG